MTGRNSQVARIYCALTILEGAPQGLSVTQLAERLKDRGHDASKRTIYRDMGALSAAGFPLSESDDKTEDGGTIWRLERSKTVGQNLVLSARELIALYLARGVLSPLQGTPTYQDLKSAFDKIEERLGSKHQEFFETLAGEIQFQPVAK
jgi:predicted DNA-binding transcriptional regulator YafY